MIFISGEFRATVAFRSCILLFVIEINVIILSSSLQHFFHIIHKKEVVQEKYLVVYLGQWQTIHEENQSAGCFIYNTKCSLTPCRVRSSRLHRRGILPTNTNRWLAFMTVVVCSNDIAEPKRRQGSKKLSKINIVYFYSMNNTQHLGV